MHLALQCALANAVFSGQEHCVEEMSRRRTISPNSPFTDSPSCLTSITCTKPPKVMILINDKSDTTKYWSEKMVKMSVTSQILQAINFHQQSNFNDWCTQKMRRIQSKMKKDNGRQTEANQRRRPPGTEGAEIWANKSMMSSSNVEAPPKVWVSSYEDSNAS